MAHAGSWLGLPDFGITEWLQSKLTPSKAYAASGGSNIIGPSKVSSSGTSGSWGSSGGASGSWGTPSPTGSSSGGGGGDSSLRERMQKGEIPWDDNLLAQQEQSINRQVEDLGSIIDRDYETAMGSAQLQEESLRGQASNAVTQAEAGYAPARTQIQNEQTTAEGGVQRELTTAEAESKTALQQARDIFRQIQQKNIAQTSGLGISSSSVTEALAERLGVETARRIAGITASVTEIRQNAARELTRIKTYYQGKLSDLETQLAAAKNNIQTQLMAGINQINQARNQAAADKANRRTELISNAQTALSNLAAKAQEFQQSLQMWEAQKTAALTPVAQDPNYIQKMLANLQTIQQAPGMSQYNIGANINQNPQGQMYGSYNIKPKEDEELGTYEAWLRQNS